MADVARTKLIQKILESDIDMQAKLDILAAAGIPLGAEYELILKVTTENVGTKWLDRLASFIINDDKTISMNVSDLKERELGDDEWHDKKWSIPQEPEKVAPKAPASRVWATTGQLSSSYRKPQSYKFHISDDGIKTNCGYSIRNNWKRIPWDPNLNGYKARAITKCGACVGSGLVLNQP